MSKIVQFPSTLLQRLQVPELEQEIEDIEFESICQQPEPEHYISQDNRCYKCDHKFELDSPMPEQIWFINQVAEYSSDLDGAEVSICICDSCMMEFLSKKITFDKGNC